MNEKKTYIGTYKAIRFFKNQNRRQILARGLTRKEVIKFVENIPSTNYSFVGFDKQFYADKYFI